MFVFCSNKCKVMHLKKSWNIFILWLMASTLWVRKGTWESLWNYDWFPEGNLLNILVWTKRRKKKICHQIHDIIRKALFAYLVENIVPLYKNMVYLPLKYKCLLLFVLDRYWDTTVSYNSSHQIQ